MADIQFDVATRNARLDAIEQANGATCALELRAGAKPANCAAVDAGLVLATIDLPADWLAPATAGSKTIAGTWQDSSADNAGTAAHFRLYKSQITKDGSTCFMQGDVSGPGGGGAMEVDNPILAAGQQFTVTAFTLTDANA